MDGYSKAGTFIGHAGEGARLHQRIEDTWQFPYESRLHPTDSKPSRDHHRQWDAVPGGKHRNRIRFVFHWIRLSGRLSFTWDTDGLCNQLPDTPA